MTADSSYTDTQDSSSSRERRVSESPVIRRLRVKSSEDTPRPPAIDFSNLTLDNGTVVSTKERVITGEFVIGLTQCPVLQAECHVESVIEVPAPAVCVPTEEQFWSSERPGYPDLDFLKRHLYREGRLSEEQAIYIINKATDIFKQEPNLLHVAAPITGRVHIHIY